MSTQEIIAQVVATELAKHTEVYLNTNILGVLIKEVILDCQNAVEEAFEELIQEENPLTRYYIHS